MSLSDIGDETIVGTRNLTQLCNVHRMVGTHLDNGHLVFRAYLQQGQRHANLVVEIALGCQDTITLAEHSIEQFLGSGLAIGACDADDWYLQVLAMEGSKILQGGQDIRHEEISVIKAIANDIMTCRLYDSGIVDDCIGTALGQSVGSKLVSVETLTLEGKEDAAFRTDARIGRNDRMLIIYII